MVKSASINPHSIRIETSSFCQLKCPSCPTASKQIKQHVGFGFLRLKDFIALVDDNPQIKKIELSNYGEVFLNPELAEILAYAYAKSVDISISNGVNFNHAKDEIIEALVKYKIRHVSISVDGTTQDVYEKYRAKGKLENVLSNIKKLNFYKQKHHAKYPRLTWQYIAFGFNEHQIDAARHMAEELGMKFIVKLSWDDNLSEIKDKDKIREITGFSSRDEYSEKTGKIYLEEICNQLWDAPQINWDGKILGCCRNFWGDFGGNAFRDGMLAALNNEKISYARAMLIGEKQARSDIPCSSCDIFLKRSHLKSLQDHKPQDHDQTSVNE